ncbi:MAG: hypothetical protein E7399_00290 [Ruminococcaceae bacterium]|nr:hypothetical protein [Oscillospiraceae bacterium]
MTLTFYYRFDILKKMSRATEKKQNRIQKRKELMGYLLLLISVLSGTAKGYCGKKISGYTNHYMDALVANSLRMGMCIIIGFLLVVFGEGISDLIPGGITVLISALSGISTAVFLVSWLLSVRQGAYIMVEVLLMLGLLIPVLFGMVLFGNQVSAKQWMGIFLLVLAAYVMCSYHISVKGKLTSKAILTLIACGLSNGVTDLSQKLFAEYGSDSALLFNFYTYLFTGIILVFLLQTGKKSASPTVKLREIFGYLLVMAICLFSGSFFKTLAANYLDPIQLYPLCQGVALILSTLMASFCFREKMTKRSGFGILLAFGGLLLIHG